MSFDKDYPNRKDHRKAYRKSQRFDATCRPNGGCPWCEGNRLHKSKLRQRIADEKLMDVLREMADPWFGYDDEDFYDCY